MKTLITLLCLVVSGVFAVSFAGERTQSVDRSHAQLEVATFAGGCFWCVEADFEKVEGVIDVISGYTGGDTENPTYDQVSSGKTRHTEAVQITFDPEKVSYRELLDHLWRHIDPTDGDGQFVDRGKQYRPGVFYHNEEQRQAALESMRELEQSGRFRKPLETEVTAFKAFYPAEDFHQNYYKTNALRYKFYRFNSGRDQFIKQVWGDEKAVSQKPKENPAGYIKPSESALRQKLTSLQFKVTQREGTEPPFDNEYWDNKREGIYVDIVSGEPLFSSAHKFRSGTGWPSFTQPLVDRNIVRKEDNNLFVSRIEVRSRLGDSHLGHVFDDGPPPTGLRYCINSAALRFIAREDLLEEGYGEFLDLF